MGAKLEKLKNALSSALDARVVSLIEALGELTLVLKTEDYVSSALMLRDMPALGFEQLIDLCGVDYSGYGEGAWDGRRFAVVSHLLSIAQNWRLRLRVFAPDENLPVVDSLTGVWPNADWYEREQKRVIYQPVTIEPREITPRVIREDQYGDLGARK